MQAPNAKERGMEREEPGGEATERSREEEDEAPALTDLDVADEESAAVKGGEVKDSHDRYA
jgi:hypothetical protein